MENINKYVITELPLNEYSLMMNLTIKSLEKRDFGGYLCTSSNALGRVEGGVRLQGESSVSLSNVHNKATKNVLCRIYLKIAASFI